ncbi:MAG: DUF2807 domain-containing protein [Candidatus Obscuribacterales bacterium]|nr:DUF2807 domain-containing protein [Candidatus Obscuribacterales bacterium]
MSKTRNLINGCLAISLSICFFLTSAFLAFASSVKGSGNLKIEKRNLPDFHTIIVATSSNVFVKAGQKKQTITLSFDDNLIPLLKTDVDKHGTLTISSNKSYSSRNDLKITIDVPDLKSVNMTGAGSIDVDNINRHEFEAEINGAGDISATGKVDTAVAGITGSGNVNFENLKAKYASVHITGSGNADVNATDSVDATITGSGCIQFGGNPSHVKQNITGNGSVSPL